MTVGAAAGQRHPEHGVERQGLAREPGDIHGRATAPDHRVAGDHLARPNQQLVADRHLVHRDVFHHPGADSMRDAGRGRFQLADRGGRPSLRDALECFAATLHHDDHQTGQWLGKQQRSEHGQRCDEIRGELAAERLLRAREQHRQPGQKQTGIQDALGEPRECWRPVGAR